MSGHQRLFYFITLHRTGLLVCLLGMAIVTLPFFESNPYTLSLTNRVAIYSIVVLGLNLFIGYTGQISLGHAAFFGLGAYGSAVATLDFGLGPWVAMLLTALFVALIALALGIAALRLAGHYLAMATLGFNYVLHTILLQWDSVTGGPSGLAGIPSLTFFGLAVDTPVRLHLLLWGITLICLLACLNLVRSGVGRGLAALAGDETAASALGVDTRSAKVKIFVLSAMLASLGGSLFAHTFSYISPDTFNIFESLDLVIMVVIGGMGSLWGSLFGAGFLIWLPEWMEFFDTYKDLVQGGILVLVLMFLPQGLITGLADMVRTRLVLRRRDAAA